MEMLLQFLGQIVPLLQTLVWIGLLVVIAVLLRPEIALLRRVLVKRIETGSAFKLGPVEFGELRDKVESVAETQQRQSTEIDTLRFVISHLLTKYEVEHLRNLAGNEPFSFSRNRNFDNELRRLRDLGFIEHCPNTPFGIGSLPQTGDDLRRLLRSTKRGLEYLKLREDAASDEETDTAPTSATNTP